MAVLKPGDKVKVLQSHDTKLNTLVGFVLTVDSITCLPHVQDPDHLQYRVRCALNEDQAISAETLLKMPLPRPMYALLWPAQMDLDVEKDNRYPHKCPRCAGPAYLGAVPAAYDCQRGCR